MRRFRRLGPLAFFFGVSAAFLVLALPHLKYPRVGWEETIVPSAAVEILAGHAISPHFIPLRFAGRDWPLLFNVRGTGAVESYLMIPIFKIFGVGVLVLRLTETLLTLLTGLLFVRAARVLFDRETALTAAPLVLLNAAFLLYGTRDGFEGEILIQWFFLALSLIAFGLVLKKRSGFLPLAALALGAGVYAKLHFVGAALGMAAAWGALVASGRLAQPRRGVLFAAAACFMAGCAPLLAWNIHSGGESFRHFGELSKVSYPLGARVAIRFLQLRDYLCGQVRPVLWAPPARGWWPFRAAPVAALICVLIPSAGGRSKKIRTGLLCLAAIGLFFMFGVSLMYTPPGDNHVLPALPLVLIAYAAALRTLLPGRAARAVLVAAFLLPDFAVIRSFGAASARTTEPDAVEETARYLRLNRLDRPLNINDHDLGPEIEFLTGGQVIPVQAVLFSQENLEKNMDDAVRRSSSVFLMTQGRGLSNSDQARAFDRLLARAGRRRRVLGAFDGGRIVVFDAGPIK